MSNSSNELPLYYKKDNLMKLTTYLINLDKSNIRLQQADEQLRKYHVDYQRISAVDGRGLDVKNYEGYNSALAQKNMGRELLGAEIGCFLSHKKCLEEFLTTDADYLLVLEDDLILCENFKVIIQQTIQVLQNRDDWYVINIAAKKRKMTKVITSIAQHELLHAYYFPVLTLGLLWSREGAQKFLQSTFVRQIGSPIDVSLQSWLCENGKGLSFYPPLVTDSAAQSDIDGGKNQQRIGCYFPRQKRMWHNRLLAFKHLLSNK